MPYIITANLMRRVTISTVYSQAKGLYIATLLRLKLTHG